MCLPRAANPHPPARLRRLQGYVIAMGAANLLLICIFRKMGGLQLDVAALSAGRPQHMDAVGRRGRAGLRCVRERERERQRDGRPAVRRLRCVLRVWG
jgi:hypothetical protein